MAVLIKGKSIKCSQKARDHYLRGEENERITVREVLGFATKDPEEALRMVELMALGTRCKKPLYSAKINPEPDRPWNKQEILRAIELLEENLGLKGHQRVVVEHKKKGRVHYHVLWNRFPSEGGVAKNMGNDYAIHQKTQKQINKEFKLRPMIARGTNFKDWEVKWAKRYGFDIIDLRKQMTAAFNRTENGRDFHAFLKSQGVLLCQGEKERFVLVLPWGQHKALSSMMLERPTKAVLGRALADIDRNALPTVEAAKAQIKQTLPKAKRQTRSSRSFVGRGHGGTKSAPITMPKIFVSPTRGALHKEAGVAVVRQDNPPAPSQPVAPNRKGWPEAAVIDWEVWGHKNPQRFFAIWLELKPDGFVLFSSKPA